MVSGGEEILDTEEETKCILLIDGDIVAYRPAAATDGRRYEIHGHVGAWKYKKDVVEHCKKNSLSPADIMVVFEPEPLTHALAAVKMQMRGILAAMGNRHEFCEYEVYLTDSKENFRLDINPQYKANRKGIRRPHHLQACKDYLVQNYAAQFCGSKEADDQLTIRATQLKEEGTPYVICSIDKDLKQMDGWHYDWVKEEYWYVDEAQGREILWGQVVTGDNTDNILVPEGIGPAKAKAIFKDVDFKTVTDDTLYGMVTELYCTFLGKCGKKKKDAGIQAVRDFSDVRCFVEQVYNQVYLLRRDL